MTDAQPVGNPEPHKVTVGAAGALGGGVSLIGLAAWAVTAMTGLQDDFRVAQSKMETRLGEIAGDVRVMAATVQRLDVSSKASVTESRVRDIVRLMMLEAEKEKPK